MKKVLTLVFAVMMSSIVMAQSAEECFKKGSEYFWKENYAEAMSWYRKAANQGYARAYMMLGHMYKSGYGVQEDKTQAVAYYRKAAEKGYSSAQNQMGICYEIGNGVTRNMTEAVKWYRKAAMTGYAEAQYNLGWCYENGKGVAKNMTEAKKWYKKAEAQDCKSGGLEVTSHRAVLAVGKILGKYADAEKDFKKGKEYYDNKNYTEAVKLFRKAADSDHGSAPLYLGFCYEKGYGVTQNYTEAVKWYRKAAENKNAAAQCNLGFFYEKGYGVTKNLTEAVNWYRKAAENGSSVAQCNLGGCYENGIGVTKDYAEAVKWYRKAAEKENTRAIDALKRIAEYDRVNGTSYSLVKKKVVMERRYMVNKANNYCYPATCFRMDNGLQLEIRYFNTDHYQGSYSNSRHGIYIAVGRCEDVNFDWNVKDCDYFDAWYVCAVTINQWVNEKIEFDESGNVSYYMDGKFMGSHQFEMLKKLAGSKTLTFDINPYGWYTGQHHYMDDLKLTLPTSTISDNFNDGVLDSKIWQTPTNPSGVREEGGILKTEQVRTDWPFHLRTKALSLTGGSQNSSSNSTLAQKTTMTAEEMYILGLDYYDGRNGKTKNYTEAVKLFQKAAEQGNVKAQNHLGFCYRKGHGVTRDDVEAIRWYRKAAENGNATAMNNLGVCYENGFGVTKNLTDAKYWYQKAADKGQKDAKKSLERLNSSTKY